MTALDVAAVYAEYHPLVRGWFGARLGPHQEHVVDDLSSAVWEKVCRAAGRYEDRGYTVGAWLWQIQRNVLTDWFRRQRESSSLATVDIHCYRLDAGSDQHAAMLDARGLLATLPPRERAVMTERYLLGYVPTEIAQRAGVTHQAARGVQIRAVKRLRNTVGLAS